MLVNWSRFQEAQRKAKAEKKAATGKGVSVGGAEGAQGENKHGHAPKSAVSKTHAGGAEGRDEEHGGHSHHQSRTTHGQRTNHPAKITKSASLVLVSVISGGRCIVHCVLINLCSNCL